MNYFYHQQFKKHIVQFMEIFRGLEVKTGKSADGTEKVIDVPIVYGSMDRVAASIAGNNTQNAPLRLPTMAAYMSNISMATDRYKGIDTLKSASYTPTGGIFPNDTKSVEQLMPVPYRISMELHIYSSNLDTQWQILEQILVLFNPQLQIQTSDALFDGGKITSVELTSISNAESYPMGNDRRTVMHTLAFDMIMYLSVPAKVKEDRIKDIKLKINSVNDMTVLQAYWFEDPSLPIIHEATYSIEDE